MDKGNQLDSKTEQELLRIENHLTMTFSKLITDGFKDIKESITELFNKDIEYIKETQNRFAHHHNEHFENNKLRIQENVRIKESIDKKVHLIVDNKFELLENELSRIKESQIECKARRTENNTIEEKTDRKRNTTIAFIGLLVAALAFFTGFSI